MLLKRSAWFCSFAFCIWLALATRKYSFFPPLLVGYGGDIAWAAAFLFLLRGIFIRTGAWKLAIICFMLGVLNECSQLLYYDWIVVIRQTYIGRLMLGVGFLWSDLICYAIGTLMAVVIILLVETKPGAKEMKSA